jgi:hypothetical protein
MIGKWFKTVMYQGWGTARNQVIVIRFFSVYSSYFYCALEATSSDCTSGDDHSNGKKRKFSSDSSSDSSNGNMNTQSGNIPSSFLIQRSREVLKMLEEDETWSPEKRQKTKDLIQAFAYAFTTIVVYAKTITGYTITLDNIKPGSMVKELKRKIRDKIYIPLDQQRLIFLDTELEDDQTLWAYKIVHESTVYLVPKQEGGGGESNGEEYDDNLSSLSYRESSFDSDEDGDSPSETSIGGSGDDGEYDGDNIRSDAVVRGNIECYPFSSGDQDGDAQLPTLNAVQYEATDLSTVQPMFGEKHPSKPAISSLTDSATHSNYHSSSKSGGGGDGDNVRSEAVVRGNIECYPFSSEDQDGDTQLLTLNAVQYEATDVSTEQPTFGEKSPSKPAISSLTDSATHNSYHSSSESGVDGGDHDGKTFGGQNCGCMKCFPSSDDAPALVRLKPVRVKPEVASARVNIRNGHFATFDKILCYPVGTNAQVPVEVTRESMTQFTIRNGIFDTFYDALECCNLLAQQQNGPRLTRGNHHARSRRVTCSRCRNQFMSFWCKENEPVRLLNHEAFERYLNHPCIELERIKEHLRRDEFEELSRRDPVDQFFEHLRRDEFGENLRRVFGDELWSTWRAFKSATIIDGHTGAIISPEIFASNSSSVTSTDIVMDKGEHAR